METSCKIQYMILNYEIITRISLPLAEKVENLILFYR